ncbi:MAG TPA: hypothetical protein VGO90_01010 [Chthoniobacteraceae bacterium]|nr:hypothetical protein [Chthoniobacteraceae bacterium]
MLRRPRITASAACVLVSLAAGALQAETIKPPFGLRWGENLTRLETLLKGANATVIERRQSQGREVWDVTGILPNDLQRTVFYFRAGELVEVELQYKTENWDEAKYTTFMGDVRRRLESKYGAPELIARKEEPIGAVLQKVVGWKWNQNNTGIELYYFSVENASHSFRTLSVHYKAY